MSLSFSRRKPGIKSLAKPLASQPHMSQRLLPILWFGSDGSPSARHTANTTEISTLPSGPFIVDHAIAFSKPRVRMHYTALYNVEMADNGVEPRTSTPLIMQTFPMPTPHLASLLVSSYVSAQLPTGEIGLHQLHSTCCVTEPIPLHS